MLLPPRSRVWPPRLPLRVLRCPRRGLIHLGAARRWIALPPARPAVFTLDKLGRPGRWGVWRSGIKEEAAGRGTAAAPNATPGWSATRPRYTHPATPTPLHPPRYTHPATPTPLQHPTTPPGRSQPNLASRGQAQQAASAALHKADAPLHRVPNKLGRPGRRGVWRSGIKEEAAGRGTAAAPNATPAWSATRPRCTTQQIASKLGTLRGGFLCPHACRCACCAAPPRGRTPPWGGPAAGLFGQGA